MQCQCLVLEHSIVLVKPDKPSDTVKGLRSLKACSLSRPVCMEDVTSFTFSSGKCFLCGNEIALQASSIALSHSIAKDIERKAQDHNNGSSTAS